MIPVASVTGLPAKSAQPDSHHSATRTAHAHAPDTARSSGGETAAAHVTLDSAKAVTAPDQTAVAPRLRDQETAERTHRTPPGTDAPAGPPPAFEESPLERQARVAFDPPDQGVVSEDTPPVGQAAPPDDAAIEEAFTLMEAPVEMVDPPPTPTEKAEASFAETKVMADPKAPGTVDMSR
ncbi:MAG: hypothetical protein ACU0GG_19845 [Paracoccaceae bacterium]